MRKVETMSTSTQGSPAPADVAWQEARACALSRYRRPDQLQAGDPAPDLELARLDGSGQQRLDGFVGDRPLVLFFGSYT
jgi:hypothetical protein